MLFYDKYIAADQIEQADIGDVVASLADVRERRSRNIRSLGAVESGRANLGHRQPFSGKEEKPEHVHDIGQYLPLFHLSNLLARSTGQPEHIRQAFWDGIDLFTFFSKFDDVERDQEAPAWAKITALISEYGGENVLLKQLQALVLEHHDYLAEDLVRLIVSGGTLHGEIAVNTSTTRQDNYAQSVRLDIDLRQSAFSEAYVGDRSLVRRTLMLARLFEWTKGLKNGPYNEALLAAYVEHNDTSKSPYIALTKSDILLFMTPHKAQIAPLARQLHSDTKQVMGAAFARGDRRLNQMERDLLKINPVHPLLLEHKIGYKVFVASAELLDRLEPGSKSKLACEENLIELSRLAASFYLESLDPGHPCLLAQIETSILGTRSGEFTSLKAVLEKYSPDLQQLHKWSEAQFSQSGVGWKIDDLLAEETRQLGLEAFEFYRARLCTEGIDLKALTKSFHQDRIAGLKLLQEWENGQHHRLLAFDRIKRFRNDDLGMVDALLEGSLH